MAVDIDNIVDNICAKYFTDVLPYNRFCEMFKITDKNKFTKTTFDEIIFKIMK